MAGCVGETELYFILLAYFCIHSRCPTSKIQRTSEPAAFRRSLFQSGHVKEQVFEMRHVRSLMLAADRDVESSPYFHSCLLTDASSNRRAFAKKVYIFNVRVFHNHAGPLNGRPFKCSKRTIPRMRSFEISLSQYFSRYVSHSLQLLIARLSYDCTLCQLNTPPFQLPNVLRNLSRVGPIHRNYGKKHRRRIEAIKKSFMCDYVSRKPLNVLRASHNRSYKD